MRALTVHQPWDFALLHGKDIENRPRKPPRALIGERIALQAGLKYDYDGLAFIKRTMPRAALPTLESGVVFATTTIVGYIERDTDACFRVGVDFLSTDPAFNHLASSPWFFGPYGYVLHDTRAVSPGVRARGMQGWWPLSAEVEALVRAREQWV